MSKTTVVATWAIVGLMIALAAIAAGQSAAELTVNLFRWNLDSWAVIFVIAIAAGIAFIGSIEFRWIRDDLDFRLRSSAMGKVRNALAARRERNYPLALTLTNEVLQELDAWPWALAFRSQVHTQMGNREKATKDLDRAIALDPDNPWHRIARAELLIEASESAKAVIDLEHLGQRLPEEPEVLRLYGSALLGEGRREEALQVFNRALAASPNDVATRLARGRALADRYEHHDSDSPTAALRTILLDEGQRIAVASVVSKARERMFENDLRTAIDDFSLMLEHDPRNGDALSSRGHARLRLGMRAEAEGDFDAALNSATDRVNVLDQMALAYRAIGDLSKAVALLTEAIDTRPTAWRHLQRGMTLDSQHEYVAAVRDYDQALTIRANLHEAAAHRAFSLGMLGDFESSDKQFAQVELDAPDNLHNLDLWVQSLLSQRHRPAEALEVVNRAIERSSFEGRLYVTRARVQVALKRYASAHTDLDSAETLGADRSLIALDRSSAYFDLGDFASAEVSLANATGFTSPFRIAVLANHSTVLRRLDRLDEALTQLDQAIESSVDNERLLVSRSCLLIQMKQFDRAGEDLEHALNLNERSASALWHRAQLRSTTGDLEGALADIELTEGFGNQVKFASEIRGLYHFGRGEWRDATEHFQKAIAADSGDGIRGGLMSSLAAAFDNLGEFEDAEALFRKIADEDKEAESRLRLGICLSQQEKSEEAVLLFRGVREELGDAAQALFDRNVVPGALLEAERVMDRWRDSKAN
jgi:tetratricopeptide (TPR) repeat protein